MGIMKKKGSSGIAERPKGNDRQTIQVEGSQSGSSGDVIVQEDREVETVILKKRQHRNTIVLSVVLLILFGAGYLFQRAMLPDSGLYAVIQLNGEEFETFDLDRDQTFIVGEKDGDYNVVVVKNGKIYVSEANCANQICVKTGEISNPGEVIACLPHGMIIYIEEDK